MTTESLYNRSSALSERSGNALGKIALQEPTMRVEGADIDRERLVKKARMSPPRALPNEGSADSAMDEAPEMEVAVEGSEGMRSVDSIQSMKRLAVHAVDEDEISENEDSASEVAQETIEVEIIGRSHSQAGDVTTKRPKGWHLRRENQRLRQAVLQGSPVRSERQDSMDTQDTNGYEPAAILRRLPGRRRAPHTDPQIEADMRRQLELKIAYRAVVKSLKPVLAELAERTEEDLTKNPDRHGEFAEYDSVIAELDARLEARLAAIHSGLREEKKRIKREYAAVQALATSRYMIHLNDCFDAAISTCKHHYTRLLRQSQRTMDDDATEDEEDVGSLMSNPEVDRRASDLLKLGINTRCQQYIENDKLWADLECRCSLHKHQLRSEPASIHPCPRGFAVYDGTNRARAFATTNLLILMDAHLEVEKVSSASFTVTADKGHTRLAILAAAANMAPLSSQISHHQPVRQLLQQPYLSSGSRIYPSSRHSTTALPLPIQVEHSRPLSDVSYDPQFPYSSQEQSPKGEGTHAGYVVQRQTATILPMFEVVSSIASAPGLYSHDMTGTPRQRRYPPARPSEDQRPSRRKAFTFDIIMRQPDEPVHDANREPEAHPSVSHERLGEAALTEPERETKRPRRPGPRAVHTNTGVRGLNTASEAYALNWRPFSNSMGPPIAHQPSYVQEPANFAHLPEPGHQASNEVSRANESMYHRNTTDTSYAASHERACASSNYRPLQPLPLIPWKGPSQTSHGELMTSNEQPSGLQGLPGHSEPHKSRPNRPITPTMANSEVNPIDIWRPYQPPVTSEPQAFFHPETTVALQRKSQSGSPSSDVQPNVDRTAMRTPLRYVSGPPESSRQPQDLSATGNSIPLVCSTRFPGSIPDGVDHAYQEYGPYEAAPFGRVQDEKRNKQQSSDTDAYMLHSDQRRDSSRTPGSGHGHEEQLPSSMHSHPGQRIGQQLLPSTLDPNRPPSSSTTPIKRQRKQHSSSESARGWKAIEAPQQIPSASRPCPNSQLLTQPLVPPPLRSGWQQKREAWPNHEEEQVQAPSSGVEISTSLLGSTQGAHDEYHPYALQTEALGKTTQSDHGRRDSHRTSSLGLSNRRGRHARANAS